MINQMQPLNLNDIPGFNDLKNWKKTTGKKYHVYMCMPPLGTKIFNKFENRTYHTTERKRFVISGTQGELYTISAKELNKRFKTDIPADKNNEYRLHDYIEDMVYPYYCNGRRENVITWRIISCYTYGNIYYTFNVSKFVGKEPLYFKDLSGRVLCANKQGVEHGEGDFIVCGAFRGKPDFYDLQVVNGTVFSDIFDMRAYPGYNASKKTLQRPKDLFDMHCIGLDPIVYDDKYESTPAEYNGFSKKFIENMLDSMSHELLYNMFETDLQIGKKVKDVYWYDDFLKSLKFNMKALINSVGFKNEKCMVVLRNSVDENSVVRNLSQEFYNALVEYKVENTKTFYSYLYRGHNSVECKRVMKKICNEMLE